MNELSTALAQYKCTVLLSDRSGNAKLEYDKQSDFLLKYTGSLCSASTRLEKLFVGMLMQILTFN